MILLCSAGRSVAETPFGSFPQNPPSAESSAQNDKKSRADKRYEEMLGRMQAAVEEVAQLYGNPIFLQVFTNDAGRASALKERLRNASKSDDAGREMAALEKRREDILNDIALREREAARLATKLVRQRAALDALADAVEKAKRVVEETSK